MKKLQLITILCFVSTFLYSQDTVYKKDGSTMKVNISEINDNEIVYSYPNETIVNKEPIEKLSKIEFKSGRVQEFSSTNGYNTYGLDLEEPKYIGEILYVNENGEAVELEQQKASRKSGANATMLLTGIGKVKVKNKVEGASSPIKIKKRDRVQFLVRVPDNNYDPKDELNVFQLEVKRNDRYIEVASANSFGSTKSNDIKFYDFNAKKYGESSLLITIDLHETGEYVMTLKDSREVFNMFSVTE